MAGFLSPLALARIAPWSKLSTTADGAFGAKLRVRACTWGLTTPTGGVPMRSHPIFEGLPQAGLMGRELVTYQSRLKTSRPMSSPAKISGSLCRLYHYDEEESF